MAKRVRDQEAAAAEDRANKKAALSKSDLIDTITETINEVSNSEDEDVSDYDSDEREVEHPGKSVGKTAKKTLTAQDVQIARETAELFKSNIFKLQIDELIKEVRLKDTKVAKIEKFLHRLYDLVQDIPDFKEKSLEQVENYFRHTEASAPFNDPKPTNVNYKFGYSKPGNMSIVGSFGLKTAIQSPRGLSIDMNLTMPADLFQPKDYMNYRALHKRAFYLGYLAENLRERFTKEKLHFLRLSYTYLNGDILTPVLKIEATNEDLESEYNFHKTKFAVNILVGFPYGTFDSKKLLPMKNCIRVQRDQELELPPTPLYNSSILSMTTYDHYLKFLYKTKKSTDQYKEACILGRIWLSQRGLASSLDAGGFGHFEFASLTAALLNGGGEQGNKILLSGFSSYQLFKGVITYLATEDICTDGYLQFYSDSSELSKYYKGGFNTPTLFDKTTKINLFHKMSKNSYKMLVKHAKRTLVMLNDVVQDRFDSLFLKNSNLDYLKYDHVMRFNINPNDDDSFGPFEKITNLTYETHISTKISKILDYGVGDRLEGFSVWFDKRNDFDISKRKASSQSQIVVNIGLLVNSQQASKFVVRGPLETEDTTQFRSFWGKKESLRKFADGSIRRAVVFTASYYEPPIITMVKYILTKHINEKIDIQSGLGNLHKQLPLPNVEQSLITPLNGNNTYVKLREDYDALYRIITKLELPLTIKSVLPSSPSLRSTPLLQPVPEAVASKDFFNDLIVQFETSVKWPDELSALEKVKTAFLLKIHEILKKETSYASFLVKDEESVPYNFDITTLNIITPRGYGFRLRILTERDEILYLRAIENSKKDKRQMLESIYMKFNQKYMGAITHTRTMSTIAHHFPFFSVTARLFKKWLDEQLLLCHFPEELIELIALQPFVDPAQSDAPASAESGFFRILHFLSQWNWKEDPLIMDVSKTGEEEESEIVAKLSDRLTVQKYKTIKSNFEQLRKQDPLCMKTQFFVASKSDESGLLWSHGIPLPIAARLTALSKVAMQLVNRQGVESKTLDLLFTPSLGDYDFVIKVKSQPLVVDSGILPEGMFRNTTTLSCPRDESYVLKLDPVQKLVRELQNKFQGTVIFSHHTQNMSLNGESVITGLVVPARREKTGKFKVQIGCNVKLIGNEDTALNKEAMLTEILEYAGDLAVGFESKF